MKRTQSQSTSPFGRVRGGKGQRIHMDKDVVEKAMNRLDWIGLGFITG